MSSQVTTAFVEQYKSNVLNLVQQRGSVLRDAVLVDSAVVGKKKFTEQVGTTNAQLRVSRHSDSPMVDTPHLRRSLTLADYEWGDMIDDSDRIRLLIDPSDAYAQNAAWAMGRAIDDVIITAALGTAYTGVTGSTATTLPSGQKVAVGSGAEVEKLTIEKLRSAKKLFMENEVSPDETLYMAITAAQMDHLLGEEELTSADYATVRALVNGEIDTFMGFKFLHTERLTLNSDGDRQVIAWAESGIELGIGADVRSQVSPRPDKSFSTYVYFSMSLGATRLEEEKVVEIACTA